jgi:hypothetical protein
MPIAKLKYLVANGDLVTGNFAPCIILQLDILHCLWYA